MILYNAETIGKIISTYNNRRFLPVPIFPRNLRLRSYTLTCFYGKWCFSLLLVFSSILCFFFISFPECFYHLDGKTMIEAISFKRKQPMWKTHQRREFLYGCNGFFDKIVFHFKTYHLIFQLFLSINKTISTT
jgi:hypothetical protein